MNRSANSRRLSVESSATPVVPVQLVVSSTLPSPDPRG